jgi:ABC-type transport system involved in cytochrome c biogenesis permease subunit
MSEVLKNQIVLNTPQLAAGGWPFRSYAPAALPLIGAGLMLLLRLQLGGEHFIEDGALMMLALACYLTAATFHLINLYAPSSLAQRLGLWLGCAGVFLNLSSWLVRWVAAHDHELATFVSQGRAATEMPWAFRYIPFANLYDLSLAFAFGAGITTMLISGRRNYRFIGALSLPPAALILLLARFIGNDFINLPPVLDSYWRPIHVGIASLSYGVALVCFAAAVIYLLKDGVKTEAMAIWAAVFGLFVFATVSRFSVFTSGTYSASTFMQGSPRLALPLRADVPFVGAELVVSGLLLVGVTVFFGVYLLRRNETARIWGHRLLKLSLVAQAIAVLTLVAEVKSMTDVVAHIDAGQYERFGHWLAQQQGLTREQIALIPTPQLVDAVRDYVQRNGSALSLSVNANPVELAALVTVFAATFFCILFSFRTERLRAALPSAEKLDGLMYKTASVAFAGLAMLLITGAVWANESWGRYWGWDSKETGAFVAWLTYGGFLHARITRGLAGRRAAYFAVVAFLLVIFTYLGVSYLLPGLHSYA